MAYWPGDMPKWDAGGSNSPTFGGGIPDWWQKFMQLMRGQFPTFPEGQGKDWGWIMALQRYEDQIRGLSKPAEAPPSPPMRDVGYGGGGSYGGGGRGIGADEMTKILQNQLLQKQISQMGSPGWLPQMFSDVYSRLGIEQTQHRDWIRDLMNLTRSGMRGTTADLARGLGSHLSRTNTPIPAGADVMARRYLSPMTQSMDAQLQYLEQLLQKPTSQLGAAAGLTSQLAPLFNNWWGQASYPGLSKYLGGGR